MGKEKNPRKVSDNEAISKLRMLKISPQKLNLVVQLIRGKKVDKALAELTFSKKNDRQNDLTDPTWKPKFYLPLQLILSENKLYILYQGSNVAHFQMDFKIETIISSNMSIFIKSR